MDCESVRCHTQPPPSAGRKIQASPWAASALVTLGIVAPQLGERAGIIPVSGNVRASARRLIGPTWACHKKTAAATRPELKGTSKAAVTLQLNETVVRDARHVSTRFGSRNAIEVDQRSACALTDARSTKAQEGKTTGGRGCPADTLRGRATSARIHQRSEQENRHERAQTL